MFLTYAGGLASKDQWLVLLDEKGVYKRLRCLNVKIARVLFHRDDWRIIIRECWCPFWLYKVMRVAKRIEKTFCLIPEVDEVCGG